MNPMEGANMDPQRVDTQERDVRPVVRRVSPGDATTPPKGDAGAGTGDIPASGGLSPADLAAGMTLTDEERRLVDGVLPDITNREREVLFEIVAGGTNERVAERMGVKLPTLRTHLMRLNQKLGSTSKSDLVRLVTQTIVLEYRERLSTGDRVEL